MKRYLAMVVYRCFVAGEYTGGLDLQVQYHRGESPEDVELAILAGGGHEYQNPDGEPVSWRLDEIVQVEEFDPDDPDAFGDEVIGFIRDEGGFIKE